MRVGVHVAGITFSKHCALLRILKMTSCEKRSSSAYSEDIRWRVIWQRHGLGRKCNEVAENLSIDKSTVCKITSLFDRTGSVKKRAYPSEKSCRKITLPVQLLIFHLVMDKPGITLREIQEELVLTLLVDVTICRFLHNSGFTYQKLKIVATQQDELCRQLYISDVSLYNRDSLWMKLVRIGGTAYGNMVIASVESH